MSNPLKRINNWRTTAAATVGVPAVLREIANLMDADPTTPVNWSMLLMGLSMVFGFMSAGDAKAVSKATAKAEQAKVAATEAQTVAVAAVQVAGEAAVRVDTAVASAADSAASSADSASSSADSAASSKSSASSAKAANV